MKMIIFYIKFKILIKKKPDLNDQEIKNEIIDIFAKK